MLPAPARDPSALLAAIQTATALGADLIRLHGAQQAPDGEWFCTCARGAACHSPGKHPWAAGWQHAPPISPEAAADALGLGAVMGIGWRMGQQANGGGNLLAIDVDDPERFADWLAAERVELPPTYMQRTARGGLHLVYSLPAGVSAGNAVVKGRGYDLRGTGGQIVLAGNVLPHGSHALISPGPIAELPAATLAALVSRPLLGPAASKADMPAASGPVPALKRARAWALSPNTPRSVSGDRGHTALLKVASGLIKGFALPREAAAVVLREYNAAKCDPPWTDRELEHKLDEAEKSDMPLGAKLAEPPPLDFSSLLPSAPGAAAGPLWATGQEKPPSVLTPEICIEQARGKGQASIHFFRPLSLGLLWSDLTALRHALAATATAGPHFTPESVQLLTRLGPELAGTDVAREYAHAVAKATTSGNGLAGLQNLLACLPGWAGALRYNLRTGQVDVCGPLPLPARMASTTWTDQDTTALRAWIGVNYGATPTKADVYDSVKYVAQTRAYDPVRDWLEAVEPTWDGTPRLDHWLTDWMGATADGIGPEYVRQVGRKWILSAVGRTFQPGEQADYMLILGGEQGIRKSSILRALFSPPGLSGDYFCELSGSLAGKEFSEAIRGIWCVEMAELSAFSKAESERIKAVVTARTDRFREPYAVAPVTLKRTTILAGTTNREEYLQDDTGARRYWPVWCTRRPALVGQDGGPEAIAQLWAEAMCAYRKAPAGAVGVRADGGEDWHTVSEDLATQAQEAATDASVLSDPLWAEIANAVAADETCKQGKPVGYFLKLANPDDREMHERAQRRMARILKSKGWVADRRMNGGTRQRLWFPTLKDKLAL